METNKSRRIIVGITTTGDRYESLKRTIHSLNNQTIKPDKIILYDNSINEDLTDNGKFYGLKYCTDDDIYFTCDDDIYYPATYIERYLKYIDKYQFITIHGRLLLKNNLHQYYRGHEMWSCLRPHNEKKYIDVAGTGVSAYNLKYIDKDELFKYMITNKLKMMSDCLVSFFIKEKYSIRPFLIPNLEPVKDLSKCNTTKHSCYSFYKSKGESEQVKIINNIWKI